MKWPKNRLINLSIYGLICLSHAALAQEDKATFTDEQPKGFSMVGDQLSGGSLSQENKQYITEVFKKMGKSPLRFRRTLESFSENVPGYAYICTSPLLGYCYINEPWFNTLSESEKRFVIGRAALDSTHQADAKNTLVYAGVAGTGCYLAYKLYKKLGEGIYEHKPGLLVKSLSTLAALVIYTKITDRLVLRPLARYNEFQKDKQAALKLQCVDGALSVLQKMENDKLNSLVKNTDRVNRLKVLKKA